MRFLESMLKVVEKSGMMDDGGETVRRLSFMMFSAAARHLRGVISRDVRARSFWACCSFSCYQFYHFVERASWNNIDALFKHTP